MLFSYVCIVFEFKIFFIYLSYLNLVIQFFFFNYFCNKKVLTILKINNANCTIVNK